jgi:hypothetical protein
MIGFRHLSPPPSTPRTAGASRRRIHTSVPYNFSLGENGNCIQAVLKAALQKQLLNSFSPPIKASSQAEITEILSSKHTWH